MIKSCEDKSIAQVKPTEVFKLTNEGNLPLFFSLGLSGNFLTILKDANWSTILLVAVKDISACSAK